MNNNKYLPIEEGPDPSNDNNSVIKEMRAKIDASNAEKEAALKDKADLEARLQAIEAKDLSEKERLSKEVEDLKGAKEREESAKSHLSKYEQSIKTLYEETLTGFPEDKREAVRTMTFNEQDILDSLNRIKAAAKVITPVTSQGNVTNPGAPPPSFPNNKDDKNTPPPPPTDIKAYRNIGWGAVLSK